MAGRTHYKITFNINYHSPMDPDKTSGAPSHIVNSRKAIVPTIVSFQEWVDLKGHTTTSIVIEAV